MWGISLASLLALLLHPGNGNGTLVYDRHHSHTTPPSRGNHSGVGLADLAANLGCLNTPFHRGIWVLYEHHCKINLTGSKTTVPFLWGKKCTRWLHRLPGPSSFRSLASSLATTTRTPFQTLPRCPSEEKGPDWDPLPHHCGFRFCNATRPQSSETKTAGRGEGERERPALVLTGSIIILIRRHNRDKPALPSCLLPVTSSLGVQGGGRGDSKILLPLPHCRGRTWTDPTSGRHRPPPQLLRRGGGRRGGFYSAIPT